MKQGKIMNAYHALSRLYIQPLPIKEAYKIFGLRKQLDDQYKFEIDREKQSLEQTGGYIDEDGEIRFRIKENAKKFTAAINELSEMEVDIQIKPITIKMDELADLKITPVDIEYLDGFVVFE